MLLALAGVIWAIRALQSYEGPKNDDALSVLLGGDAKPFNWCPENTILVEWFAAGGDRQRTFEKATEAASVCELMIEGFSSEGLEKPTFRKLLVATDSQGKEKVLEKAEGHEVYRVDGMPFKAPMLKKALERLDKKPAPEDRGL
ncbi:hypothetical protein D3C87_86290 [compost metagenome]